MEEYGPYINGGWVKSLPEKFETRNPANGDILAAFLKGTGEDVNRAVDDLEAGITYINAPTIGAEVPLPFGGIKNTGNGAREAGTAAIEEFTENKTVFIDYSGRLQKAQIQE